MNIISNTCIGAYLIRDYNKQQFTNPFIWNIIEYDSLANIIKNFDKLKSDKNEICCIEYKENNYPILEIKNLSIKIRYVHYKDAKYKNKLSSNDDNNIFLQDCCAFAFEKYKERLARMNDEPIFVLHVQYNHPITGDVSKLIENFSSLNTDFKVHIIFPENVKLDKSMFPGIKNLNLIKIPSGLSNMPKEVAKHYNKLII